MSFVPFFGSVLQQLTPHLKLRSVTNCLRLKHSVRRERERESRLDEEDRLKERLADKRAYGLKKKKKRDEREQKSTLLHHTVTEANGGSRTDGRREGVTG